MTEERRQEFHDNSDNANEALKGRFIEFGTKLDESLKNPEVITEVYMVLRKTSKKDETTEHDVLVSAYDTQHLRTLVLGILKEALLCEVTQSKILLEEQVKKGKKPTGGALLDACYAARLGRDSLGYVCQLIKEFQEQTSMADCSDLDAFRVALERISNLFTKVVVQRCGEKHNCEGGPLNCAIRESIE